MIIFFLVLHFIPVDHTDMKCFNERKLVYHTLAMTHNRSIVFVLTIQLVTFQVIFGTSTLLLLAFSKVCSTPIFLI